MSASYSSKELSNDEVPVPDMASLPSESHHRMPDGTIHPVQVGLRMVESFRFRCRESVEANPLRPVAMVYEEELSKIKSQLADPESQNDMEDFVSLCPTLLAMSASLYRYIVHHHHHHHRHRHHHHHHRLPRNNCCNSYQMAQCDPTPYA